MLAAMLYGPYQLHLEQVPKPELGEGEALIRITACGICPSDVRLYTGQARLPAGKVPFLAGHEWAGEVVDVRISGPIPSAIRPGSRVAACWLSSCGECEFCRRGYPNYCVRDNRARVTGGFAEYGKAPVTSLWEIPTSLPYEEAVFAEPLACCVNGQERSSITPRDDVLVIGAGPVGLLHAQLARAQGARVIVCDLAAERLEIARGLGIEETVHIGDTGSAGYRVAAQQLREMTEGKGPDKVIVAANSVGVIDWALDVVAPCGVINVFAGLYPESRLDVDFNVVHYKQVTITGSHDFNHRHFDAAVNLLVRGQVKVRKLISHVVSLSKLEEGFVAVAERRGMKVVVSMNGGESAHPA
ncbi:MAG: alcohol dehydrogenase catalytic domain-containing protein [Firmicutes bacterium]|nr:alcohol dehydrogenase catalytic domain-containing protein [Bacillota bacterium]